MDNGYNGHDISQPSSTPEPQRRGGSKAQRLEAHGAALQKVLQEPPEHAAKIVFMYRQTVAKRQASETKIRSLQGQLQAAQSEHLQTLGAERAFHDALCALVDLDASAIDP